MAVISNYIAGAIAACEELLGLAIIFPHSAPQLVQGVSLAIRLALALILVKTPTTDSTGFGKTRSKIRQKFDPRW